VVNCGIDDRRRYVQDVSKPFMGRLEQVLVAVSLSFLTRLSKSCVRPHGSGEETGEVCVTNRQLLLWRWPARSEPVKAVGEWTRFLLSATNLGRRACQCVDEQRRCAPRRKKSPRLVEGVNDRESVCVVLI